MTFEEQAALMGQTGLANSLSHMPMNVQPPHWADYVLVQATAGNQYPLLFGVAPQHQHPLERGWSQHHLDALLDVELGLL
jgi:hypothetical protein